MFSRKKIAKKSLQSVRKDDTNIAHLLITVGILGFHGDKIDQKILKRFATDTRFHSLLRTEALTQLFNFPKNFSQNWLAKLVRNDPVLPMKRLAIRALGLIGNAETNKILCKYLTDNEPTIRFTAAYALDHATSQSYWVDFFDPKKKNDWKESRKNWFKDANL